MRGPMGHFARSSGHDRGLDTIWSRIWAASRPGPRRGAGAPRPSRQMRWDAPSEVLEARRLLSFTDVSQYAATITPPGTATNLYINFDGGTVPRDPVHNPNGNLETVQPFEGAARDTGLNRERDIQDLLFQVSEAFAPYNVQVHRITGAGNYSKGQGDTTIFVGGVKSDSTATVTKAGYLFEKYAYSFTPSADVDSPTSTHKINSDQYDIAFVDPVIGTSTNPLATLASEMTRRGVDSQHVDVDGIRAGIAHEAAHTFGLSHVRTDGQKDNSPLTGGSVDDVLSYDSPNTYFADLNLTLTSANNSGTSTTFTGSYPNYLDGKTVRNFVTQNSDRTLTDVLGTRPTDQYDNVANSSLVDPHYATQGVASKTGPETPKVDVSNLGASTLLGLLSRPGDYEAFTITPKFNRLAPYLTATQVVVTPNPYLHLQPEVLLYDSTGRTLISFAGASSDGVARLTLVNGHTYTLVVGSHDGNSTGLYTLGLKTVSTSVNTTAAATPTGTTANVTSTAVAPVVALAPQVDATATTLNEGKAKSKQA